MIFWIIEEFLLIFVADETALHEYSRHYPRYTPEETDAKIQHFRDSGTGPMLCTTIAEKGFVCPKLKDGGCPGVNAPAALPFVLKKTARPWYRETKSGSMILSRGVLAEHLKVRYPALHSSGLFHLYQDGVYLPFSDMEIEPASIEDIMLFYIKGEKL